MARSRLSALRSRPGALACPRRPRSRPARPPQRPPAPGSRRRPRGPALGLLGSGKVVIGAATSSSARGRPWRLPWLPSPAPSCQSRSSSAWRSCSSASETCHPSCTSFARAVGGQFPPAPRLSHESCGVARAPLAIEARAAARRFAEPASVTTSGPPHEPSNSTAPFPRAGILPLCRRSRNRPRPPRPSRSEPGSATEAG